MDQKLPAIEKNLEEGEIECQQFNAKMAANSNLETPYIYIYIKVSERKKINSV